MHPSETTPVPLEHVPTPSSCLRHGSLSGEIAGVGGAEFRAEGHLCLAWSLAARVGSEVYSGQPLATYAWA